MQILSVDNFEQMGEIVRGVDGRHILTGREVGGWTLGSGKAGRLAIYVGDQGGANYYEGAAQKDATGLYLPLSDPRPMRFNGHELDWSSLAIVHANSSVTNRLETAGRASLLVWPVDLFRSIERFDANETAALQGLNGVLTVNPSRLASLRRIVLRFAAIEAPLSVSAERTAEEEFMVHVLHALESRTESSDLTRGRPWISREQVLRKVRDLIASAEDQVLYVEDLCRAASVSERTLRAVFKETFGVGPIRYLRYRRLRKLHAALSAADPGRDTVADVATRFGFWEFGRLAREYHARFGELPSQTLQSGPNEPPAHRVGPQPATVPLN